MLVFLLEERSMAALLEGLLPRLVPDHVAFKLIPHDGKTDLEKSIPRKLRAWQDPTARFIVVRDQDSADCLQVKSRLLDLCTAGARPEALVRIACRELEAWYLADLAAVDRAFGTQVASLQNTKKYRVPDRLGSPSHLLADLVPTFGKVGGARRLGPLLELDNPRSPSFAHFVRGVRRVVDEFEADPSG